MAGRRAALVLAATLLATPAAAETASLLDQDLAALAKRLERAGVDLSRATAVPGNPAARRFFDVAPAEDSDADARGLAIAEENRRTLRAAAIDPRALRRAEPTALEIFRARDRRLQRRPAAAVLLDQKARRLLR